ncbi:uncharacterized protein LOC114121095 [Aphis gossypii]|uniref:uncharacterized protein LOC114121095 n=1 Tax=Aphis gossypii TaxID=80765 RepID=UPI0021594D78|nr:uncharacterized protein LOC114121095 [Aphis gossypii]
MRESPNLTAAVTAYLVLLLVVSATADVDEDDYLYTNFFPEQLNLQPSELDTTDADPDEIHELLCVDCKAVPKATVQDDDSLLLRSTTQRTDQRLGQTTVVKKSGGVPYLNHMETGELMIPIVNRIRTSTAKRTTSSVAASNRVFDFRWNDLIKKTTQIPQQSAASNLLN